MYAIDLKTNRQKPLLLVNHCTHFTKHNVLQSIPLQNGKYHYFSITSKLDMFCLNTNSKIISQKLIVCYTFLFAILYIFLSDFLKNFSYHLFTKAILPNLFFKHYFWIVMMYHRIFWHMGREFSFYFEWNMSLPNDYNYNKKFNL